jgi:sugar-specific transcriptional regulator TrmB
MNMQEVKKWLKTYGLNDTEVKIYLCILRHPDIKVSDIQIQTGLVRTTIYNALSNLKADGLLSENTQNNVKTYRANQVDTLKNKLEANINTEKQKLEQLDSLQTVFENLKAENASGNSYVSRYEGVEGVKQAIEKAFRCDSKKWHIIAARDNFLYHTGKKYQHYYLAERKRRGITAKTLWEPTGRKPELSTEDIFYRNPRVLPASFQGKFKSLVILYDDTILIIDPYEQKTAHAVHNNSSTDLMRLMFDFAWQTIR